MTSADAVPEGAVPGLGLDGAQFALIPAGTFEMGSPEGSPEERPSPSVTITRPFRLQRTVVTQRQWLDVMGELPGGVAGEGALFPLHSATWREAEGFLARLNDRDPGQHFRLPTEAEWEYAARAGTRGDYGGTGHLDDMGWYQANSGNRLHAVGEKQPNAWGLYDMHGNVWELVQDWYSPTYYSQTSGVDPLGPETGSFRVVRGGSWITTARDARSGSRGISDPLARSSIIGFRLAAQA